MKVRAIALVIAVLLPLSVGACGDKGSDGTGSGGSTSSSDNLSQILEKGGMPKAQATCIADALKDADLSDADLEALSKGDTSGLDPSAMQSYARGVAACFTTTTEK